MVKEWVITVYLLFFKCLFNVFKLFSLKKKTTFVLSFKQNGWFIYNQIKKQQIPDDLVFLCKNDIDLQLEDAKIIGLETINPIDWIKSIYHLATSNNVIIDNYYGFLSAIAFKKDVQCIQLWHAAGAIKTFGLKDRSVSYRPKRAQKRFMEVYSKFNKIVVGSEAMANIFIEAFNLPPERILRTGVPRTDLFYDKKMQKGIIERLERQIPDLGDKKVILYAPTYRDEALDSFDLHLDLEKMAQELAGEYIVLLRLHPAIKGKWNDAGKYPKFVYDYSDYPDINELLLITDVLITDYSSIPYEFALLNKPMIFYPYDLDDYQKSRGLWRDYSHSIPGPIVYSTDEIIKWIKQGQFDLKKIEAFAKKWNEYSSGHSSQFLIDYLYMPTFGTKKLVKEKRMISH
ncbi:CDP-glycerol glycerophosphotransferase family protein [Camelliibacillus cellulosilyticus]|uniref:CDP-glycerol glycerophosphotransferase family protein n=1 Tax=Camelliibacillus cellulosilyticus TaxID=2174486 RepID=A0ABV9GUY6_9BACL